MLLKRVNKLWQLTRNKIRRNLGILLFDRKVDAVICPVADLQHVVFIRWDAKWGDAIVSSLMIAPLHKPRKISCSRFLAQDIGFTALSKNVRLTYG